MKPLTGRIGLTLAVAVVTVVAMSGGEASAQSNPYRQGESWGRLPDGRTFGNVIGVDVDRGGNIWVFERCGGDTCEGSKLAPILQFDPSGKLLKSFGAGMFAFPHGLYVDRDGNVWATDGPGKGGKGYQVFKFSPDGKVLLTLGKAGVGGEAPGTFIYPSAVVAAPNGDIFVADGHGGKSNSRIVKFSKDGKFIRTWGRRGTAPGDFGELHAIAIDSSGRVFVGDRGNNRIQIFDQDGKFLAEWRQFGRPTAIYIDGSDTVYVSDHGSDAKRNPGFRRGIRIGSAQDGVVRTMIPAVGPDPDTQNLSEGIAVDANGNIYGAEVALKSVVKYVRN
jgi:sugar lactone lactonase YvrE